VSWHHTSLAKDCIHEQKTVAMSSWITYKACIYKQKTSWDQGSHLSRRFISRRLNCGSVRNVVMRRVGASTGLLAYGSSLRWEPKKKMTCWSATRNDWIHKAKDRLLRWLRWKEVNMFRKRASYITCKRRQANEWGGRKALQFQSQSEHVKVTGQDLTYLYILLDNTLTVRTSTNKQYC